MQLTLIIAAVSALLSFGAGWGIAWQLQTGNITTLKLEHASERINQQRAARTAIERTTSAVIKAQNSAAARAAVHRRDADAARAGLDGLRAQSADSLRTAAASLDACTATAATLSVISNQCAERYSELGAKAQGHVSDIQTLIESWPK